MKGGDDRKPHIPLCKRCELMARTSWKRSYVEMLVADGRLKLFKVRANSRPLYYVESAQEILDGKR